MPKNDGASSTFILADNALLSLLGPGERGAKLQAALFLTHDFNGPYFERTVLAKLRDFVPADANAQVLVLCEARQGEAHARAQGYRVQKVVPRAGSAGRFHPKLYVLLYEDCVACAVGSGNLTPGGLSHNAEIFWTDLVKNDASGDHGLRRLLKHICEQVEVPDRSKETSGLGALDMIRNRLERHISTRSPIGSGCIRSTFEEPLIKSLKKAAAECGRAWIVSPFFNPPKDSASWSWLRGLAARLENRLAVHTRDDSYARSSLAWPAESRPGLFVLNGNARWPSGMALHAKAYIFADGHDYQVFLGSPNATNQGLSWTYADHGQVETWMEFGLSNALGKELVEGLGLGVEPRKPSEYWDEASIEKSVKQLEIDEKEERQRDLLDVVSAGRTIRVVVRAGSELDQPELTISLSSRNRESVATSAKRIKASSSAPGTQTLEVRLPAGVDAEWIEVLGRTWAVQGSNVALAAPVTRHHKAGDTIEATFYVQGYEALPEPIDESTLPRSAPRGQAAATLSFLEDDRHGGLDRIVRASGLALFEVSRSLANSERRGGRGMLLRRLMGVVHRFLDRPGDLPLAEDGNAWTFGLLHLAIVLRRFSLAELRRELSSEQAKILERALGQLKTWLRGEHAKVLGPEREKLAKWLEGRA